MTALLPAVLGPRPSGVKIIDHGSKRAMLSELPRRLKAYARDRRDIRVLSLVDRDAEDCRRLKARLELAAEDAGLATKSRPDRSGRFRVVNRIVVEELEAWFFGDVPALALAYPGVSPSLGGKAAYRDPDAISGGTWEKLLRVLQEAGHYDRLDRLPKIDVARRVAAHMTVAGNSSRSFNAFVTGVRALCPPEPA